MFFVLSALVLWLPIARAALRRRDRPARTRAALPADGAAAAALLPVVLVVWALTNPVAARRTGGDLVLHLTFTHVYSDQYVFWTDGPAWSLGVEFHFYVLMALAVPLVHAAVRRAASRRARLAVVCGAAGAVPGGRARLPRLGDAARPAAAATNWSIWFSPLSRAADFGDRHGAGRRRRRRRPARGPVRGGLAVARHRRPGGPGAGPALRHGARRVVAPGVRRWRSRSPWPGSCCTTVRGRAVLRAAAAACGSGGWATAST